MDDTASSSLVGAPERTESRQRPGCGKAAARADHVDSPDPSTPQLSAAPITLRIEEEQDLRRLSRLHKTPRKLAERANMIALYAIVRDIHATLKVLLARVRVADRPQLTGTINRRDFAAVATPVTSAHVVNS